MYQLLRCVLPVLLIAASVPRICSADKMDDSNSGNLIVGGFVVSIDQVPYQAAVLHNGKFSCGGSIIGPRWILTALHCIETMEPSEYQIVVGTDDPENGTKLQVENMFAPPFLINGSVFDIALVMLRNRLEYNGMVQCLPLLKSIEEIAVGKPAVISGFESTDEGGYEMVLKAANVNILPVEECVKAYGLLIHEHMFCAGYREGQVDTCQGDSGGPLVLDSKLAGVIFYGEGCARVHYPGVYMSIPWFYDWIVNTPNDNNTANMVVGGFQVDIETVPYQAAIFYAGELLCGGSIIGLHWVLTSYHCVSTRIPSDYGIVVGVTNPEAVSRRIQVEDFIFPAVTESDKTYDIALVKLNQSLVYSEAVQCIPLLSAHDAIAYGKPAYISGFGFTQDGGPETQLKIATIQVLPWQTCQEAYPTLMRKHLLCAGVTEGQVDACQGDSGGPLVVDGQLAGVVFFGKGCADPNHPGVYISVPWFYDWIVDAARNQSNAENRELCTAAKQEL
uniref:Peptidase S1 domain-containing protein n=2 Tax=Anopheles merus TaxID=30066 RepID=A0A182V175_ANOME